MNFRKLITYLTMGTAAAMPLAVAQNPTILQGSYISNVFGNSNFIKNPNAQTNIADVTVSNATVTRSTTTPLVATSEFNITTSTSTGYADWSTRTFDAGMKGQNCEARFTYRGFSVGSTTAQILQGANVVAQLTLTASTDPRIASINFPCGDLSSATTFRLQQATASLTGTNEIGGIYVGLATNMANVAQASKVGGWDNFLCGAEPVLNTGTAVWSAPNVAGSCSGTPVGSASASLSNLNTLTFGFSNLPPGEYVLMVPMYIYPTTVTSGTARCDGRIKETTLGLLDNGNAFGFATTSSSLSIGQVTQFKFQNTTTANRVFQIELNRSNGLSNCSGGTLNFGQNVSLYRFPSSSELVVKPETQNVWGSAYYSGSLGAVWARYGQTASNVFETLSSATFAAGRTVKGKCQPALTGNNLGCSIPDMPVGNYRISVQGLLYNNPAGAGSSVDCTHRLYETQTATQISAGYNNRNNATGGMNYQSRTVEGVFTNSSVGTRNFVLQVAKPGDNSAGNINECGAFVNTPATGSDLTFTIQPLDQPSNSALYVEGPVKAAATGAAIPSGYLGKSEFGGGSGSSGAVSTGTSTVYTISNVTPGVYLVRYYASAQRVGAFTATYYGYSCAVTSNASVLYNWFDYLNAPQSFIGSDGASFTGFGGGGHLASSLSSNIGIVSVTSTTTYYLRCAYDSNNSGVIVYGGAEFVRLN